MTFIERILGDSASFTQIAMAAIGDRLGLWKDLGANGAASTVASASSSSSS